MFTRLIAYIRAWWHHGDIGRTIQEELQFHVEMERAGHEADGVSSDEARRRALADLGGTAHVRADILDVRTPRLVALADRVRQDLRYAGGSATESETGFAVLLVLATVLFVERRGGRFCHHQGCDKGCEECGNRADAERPSWAEMIRYPTDDGSPHRCSP